MKIFKVNSENTKEIVKIAANLIENGAVIVCSTDTVYGLVADATNKKAVEKIFKIKQRPKNKPLPIFIKDIKMARELAVIDKNQEKILKRYWPGKYTFVLKRKSGIKIYGVAKNTIALRIPKYRFLNDLLKKINKPLAQTSVNISGKPALTKIADIISQFGRPGLPILIVDGRDLLKNKPSVIIDLTKDKIKTLRT